MKIIITESQADTIRKVKVMEKYIDEVLSDYDWYEGINKVTVDNYLHYDSHDEEMYDVPLYSFYVITNDLAQSRFDSDSDNASMTDDIDEMFTSLFPRVKNNRRFSAVWVLRYVSP